MALHQEKITIHTEGRSIINITQNISDIISKTSIEQGTCNLFLQHTSASIILCENADPTVRQDLEAFMQRLVPDGDKLYLHNDEGPDDMPAHVRTILTQNSLTIPFNNGRLLLGTWQGIYLWEHRVAPHQRHLIITIAG
jgi:secondary thiamine-phosphate synthase enzyme